MKPYAPSAGTLTVPSWARVAARVTTLWAALFVLVFHLAAERYTFQTYGQKDGLRNLSVNCLKRDRAGYLWAGTESGLFRYDGFHFQPVGTPEINVHSLAEDPEGRLWVGAIDGLFYLDGSHWREVEQGSQHLEVAFSSAIQILPDGRLLVVSRRELLAVSTHDQGLTWEVRAYFGSNRSTSLSGIVSVVTAKSGRVWVGCGLQICEGNAGKVKVWGEEQGLPRDNWQSLFIDSGGALWARSQHRIYVLPGKSGRFIERSFGAGPLGGFSTDIREDAQGRILTTFPKGILRWDHDHWQVFNASNGLSTNEPSALAVDQENNVWIGIVGHGLEKWLGYDVWEGYTSLDGLPSDLIWGSVRDRKGRIWVGTEHGLAVKDVGQRQFRLWDHRLGAAGEQIRGIALAEDGALWIGNKAGLVTRIDTETGQLRRYTLSPVGALFADSSNGIWISTADGLFLATGNAEPRRLSDDHFEGWPIKDVTEDRQGKLWGSAGTRILRLGSNGWHGVETRTKLPARISSMVVARDGSVWLAGWFSGLIRIRHPGESSESVETYHEDALFSNNVYFLGEDDGGRIWAGTDAGVSVFDGERWSHFDTDNGLIWDDCDENAFRADSDGSVWLGTSGGISHVTGIENALQAGAPGVAIESATFGDHELGPSSIEKWTESPFVVTLAATTLRDEEALSFRYRLSGVDRNFVATNRNELRYPSLEPGDYTLEVQSIDHSRSVRSPIERLEFRIQPPWWRTKLFYAGLMLLLGVAIRALWWWRSRVLVEQKRWLEHLVQERTGALNERTRELENERHELLRAREDLQRQATHDGLTTLWNRAAILEILERELERDAREAGCTAVIMVDIDHFKKINDQHGHLVGDAVLKNIATRLTTSVRSYDAVGRYGGDEFLIVMPGWSPGADHERIERLRTAIADDHFDADGAQLTVTCSFGASWAESEVVAAEELIRLADQALYRSKSRDRNRAEFSVADR